MFLDPKYILLFLTFKECEKLPLSTLEQSAPITKDTLLLDIQIQSLYTASSIVDISSLSSRTSSQNTGAIYYKPLKGETNITLPWPEVDWMR